MNIKTARCQVSYQFLRSPKHKFDYQVVFFKVLNFKFSTCCTETFLFTLILAISFRFNSHIMPSTSFKTIHLDSWHHHKNLTFIYENFILLYKIRIQINRSYKISFFFLRITNSFFSTRNITFDVSCVVMHQDDVRQLKGQGSMNANLTFFTGEDTRVRQILGPPSHNRML